MNDLPSVRGEEMLVKERLERGAKVNVMAVAAVLAAAAMTAVLVIAVVALLATIPNCRSVAAPII